MPNIYIPSGAKYIIDTLYQNGYEGFIVGGCVRDALLGRPCNDYDITTNALPEDIKRIFKRTVDTGIAHGTVTVIVDALPYEVTTYRIDGDYIDMRHPESVSYTKNIEDDLARRDFTVNAMAYNDRVGLVDKFGGVADIKARVIRTVGNSEQRFGEDALRVLRGIRFSSVLDFDIEEKTAAAIKKLAPNLEFVSAERIYTEWKKLLGGKRAYDVLIEYSDVVRVFLPELLENSLPSREAFECFTVSERMFSLFVHGGGSRAFVKAAKALKTDANIREMGASVLNNLIISDKTDINCIKLYLIGKDDDAVKSAAKISEAFSLCQGGTYDTVLNLIEGGMPRHVSDLAIDGNALKAIGFNGKAIGDTLLHLLKAAALGEVENEKDELVSLALKIYKA